MKLLIAPVHYLANSKDGSEYTRAYEYIKDLVKDKTVEGDALVGYMDEDRIGNIKIHKLWKTKPSFITVKKKLEFLFWVYKYGGKLIRKNRYDCIWHLGPFAIGETFSLLSLFNNIKNKFVIGPIYTPLARFKSSDMGYFQKAPDGSIQTLSFRNKLDLMLYRVFVKLCYPLSLLTLKRSRDVMVIETKAQTLLQKMGIKHTSTLPLTVSSEQFKVEKRAFHPGRKVRILSVGYLVERKRMQDIIEAVKILIKKFNVKNIELTIIGDGPQKENLLSYVDSLGLGKNVKILGYVPRVRVGDYYKNSDIFVSASLSESMPGVYFEAMTSGLPLIVVDNPTSYDLASNKFGGFVVPPKSPAKIADSINKIINSKGLFESFSTKNKKLMEGKYNFRKNILKLKEILQRKTETKNEASSVSKVTRYTLNIFSALFVAGILLSSIRGLPGNPTINDLLSKEWRDNGPFELSPERGRFSLAYSFYETGSVHFPHEMAKFSLPDVGYRDGKYVSLFAPALSFIIIPGYILGKLYGNVQLGTFLVISLFAFLNFWLIYSVIRKLGTGQIAALLASFIFLFASPAFAYGVNLYQHHVTVFLILSSFLLFISSSSFVSYFFIFLLWGVGIALDYPNMFLFLPFGFAMLTRVFGITVSKLKTAIQINLIYIVSVLGVVLPVMFFFWFNTQSYGGPLNMLGGSALVTVRDIDSEGNPIAAPGKSEELLKESVSEEDRQSTGLTYFKTRNLLNGLYIHLLSQDRGVIFFTPVILFGLIGAFYLYKKNSEATVLLFAVVCANLALYSMWGDPWGGWAFGSRYLIPTYSVMAIFIAFFLSNLRRNLFMYFIFILIAYYSVYVNAAGALSTSAVPPKVQVLSLEALSGKQERYSFDRGLELLKSNHSKSFAFQTYFKNYFTAWQYFQIIVGANAIFIGLLMMILFIRDRKIKNDQI